MKVKNLLPSTLSRMFSANGSGKSALRHLMREVQEAKTLAARSLILQLRTLGIVDRLQDTEFKVFSQFGDDGIIQYLIYHAKPTSQTFVEFGVENYQEANTRFLLVNDNWRGLVMDGNPSHIQSIQREEIYWRYDLTAASAFIDCDNICSLLTEHGFSGELGILSIDIDGNDYWVWDRITNVDPTIVIVEYNSVFGADRAVTVPYNPSFIRSAAHESCLYWGCSVKALCLLALQKGYAFVGCNSNGNNAYFVKKEQLGDLKTFGPEDGYVESRFRESRDGSGQLSFLSGPQRRQAIAEMPLVDVETGETVCVADL